MTTTLTEAYYRRLDFFNHNHSPQDGKFTSGSGGRRRNGGKVWSGISADPDNRVRPKSTVSFPIEPEAYESPAEARAMFATRIYDADLGNGYQARVASVSDIHNGISVTVKIRKGHEQVALSTRELSIDGAGRLVAHHETLYVEPKHQGKGIADKFNAHAVAEYQQIGVDRIDLQAGDAVGGYAWARQGFRHFEGGRKKFLLTQLDRLDAQMKHPAPNLRPHAKKIKADSAALRKAIEAGEDVQPIHLASLGEKYARHTGRDDHGNEYPTWPGKSILIGTNWIGQYYFDANRVVTAAATDLEHAALRPAFRLEFYNHQHDPNSGKFASGGRRTYDDAGTWGNHYQSSSRITGQAADIMGISGYFPSGHPARNEYYGGEKGGIDVEEARQRATELLGAIHDATPVKKPLYSGIYLEPQRFQSLKPGDHIALPTTAASRDSELAHESSRNPYKHPDELPVVLKFEPGTKAVVYQHNVNEVITAGHFEVTDVSRVPSQYQTWKREIDDLPIADALQITLRQTHTVNPVESITAAGEWLTLACHDAACAPPPAGAGGSLPLQARRGAVAGYGPTGRRDITLGSVRVTYKPDYPDGHPDPGEVVWAKVRFQEDVNQSKDRPVLIIGRINGSDKLAAVQLTSNVTGRPDSMMIGTGSWDRLGRNSAVKLSQIIVVDPKDYRREGSKFERDKFEAVIGRLAAYHRTPVQIAAAAHLEDEI